MNSQAPIFGFVRRQQQGASVGRFARRTRSPYGEVGVWEYHCTATTAAPVARLVVHRPCRAHSFREAREGARREFDLPARVAAFTCLGSDETKTPSSSCPLALSAGVSGAS